MATPVNTLKKVLKKAPIREVKLRTPLSIEKGTPLKEVFKLMRGKKTGCAIVRRKNKIIGIFTERDLLNRVMPASLPLSTPIDEVMTPDPTVLSLEDPLAKAIKLMSKGGYRHLPLVDKKGKLTGIISVRDLVKYLAEHFPYEVYNLPPDPLQINLDAEGA